MRQSVRTRRTKTTPAMKATTGVALCMAGLAGFSQAEQQQPAAPAATRGGTIDRTVLPVVPPPLPRVQSSTPGTSNCRSGSR
jgi:hypothetical protein